MHRRLFVSLVAQSENLGDLVIRKNAVEAATSGGGVVALAAGMPEAYLRAYNLPDGSLCVPSSWRFQALLFREALRKRADLLIAPGPVVLTNKPSRLVKAAVVLANSVVVRLGGGRVMSLGRSYRGNAPTAIRLERLQKRVASVYFVRDEESTAVVGGNTDVRPDMAFLGQRIDAEASRNLISVSVRDATPETMSQLKRLRDFANHQSLTMTFVTQVKFDDDLHERLATSLGVAHVSWGAKGHSEQLRGVMDAYSRSVAVVSNRLHALIFGLQAGAAAVPVDTARHPKLQSTLASRVPLCDLDGLLTDANTALDKLAKIRVGSNVGWNKARGELVSALGDAD